MVQDRVLVSILLVLQANGDSIGCQQHRQWGAVVDDVVVAPQLDVLAPEGNRPARLRRACVLADTKQEEESHDYEVGRDAESLGGAGREVRKYPADSGARES